MKQIYQQCPKIHNDQLALMYKIQSICIATQLKKVITFLNADKSYELSTAVRTMNFQNIVNSIHLCDY